MTQQELEHLRNLTWADVQDENGIDVTQIDYLLSMSPTDRLRTLEDFLETLDGLDRARKTAEAQVEGAVARASLSRG